MNFHELETKLASVALPVKTSKRMDLARDQAIVYAAYKRGSSKAALALATGETKMTISNWINTAEKAFTIVNTFNAIQKGQNH